MAVVKSQCVTAVATVAGWSGILLTWFLGVFHQAAACCGRPPAIGCGWRSALDVRGAFSVEGLLTTGICPLAGAGLATILTMRFVGRTGRSATGYGTLPSSGSPAWPRSVSRQRRPWVC